MLFTFPSQYLFAIGLTGVFSLTGWSRRIRAEFLVFRVTQDYTKSLEASRTGLSPAMVVLSRTFCSLLKYYNVVLQPHYCIATIVVWALPRSLATTEGIIIYFLFLEVLRCFSSLRLLSALSRVAAIRLSGCPIRKSADQRLFASTRSLSQLITSFIASVSQGIRHAPLLTLFLGHISPFWSAQVFISREIAFAFLRECVLILLLY